MADAERAPRDIARELEEIQRRLAGLAATQDPARVGDELRMIRDHLRRLAADNDEIARLLGDAVGRGDSAEVQREK